MYRDNFTVYVTFQAADKTVHTAVSAVRYIASAAWPWSQNTITYYNINLTFYIFRAIVWYTQVYSQLIAHISAAYCSNLQGATSVEDMYSILYSLWKYKP